VSIVILESFVDRPPLEYAKPIEKGKCKPQRELIDKHRDFMALFEDPVPEGQRKVKEIEKPEVKKERIKKETLVNHLIEQEKEKKECK